MRSEARQIEAGVSRFSCLVGWRMMTWVACVIAALVMPHLSYAHAHCDASADAIYIRLDVQNNTSHDMYLDMGKPKYGKTDGSGWIRAGGHYSSFYGCGVGMRTGYASHIRLYNRGHGDHKYLAEWDIDSPYYELMKIRYQRHSDVCAVAVWRKSLHPSSWGTWSAMEENNLTPFPVVQIYVRCGE